MSAPLMKSVSGIRGIVGETFTPDLIITVSSAFAEFVKYGTVVVGRDSRPTGEALSMNIISTLALCGCNVIDIGLVPTPTVQIMVEELKADGGIVISASHNPIEWNAFKLINKEGRFLNSSQIKKVFSLMGKKPKFRNWDKVGRISFNRDSFRVHIEKVLSVVDVELIRSKNFRVVIDSVNGAGSEITIELLKRLNCEIIPINCSPNGIFPRGAEPLPENLSALSAKVKEVKAHIGFAQDPDADRLALIDEKGLPCGEEYTIALVSDHLLSKKKGRVVVNLSTTKAVEDIALRHGVLFKRTKVGEINVVEEMVKNGARIGGEGNGGIISPEIHYGRDSLAGIAYILEMMAEREEFISQILSKLPQYYMKKGKVTLKAGIDTNKIFDKIRSNFPGDKISTIDGLRIDFVKNQDFKGGWVHLRASNTEPIFRIISEAETVQKSESIYKYFSKIITA
ncbi:MAG TPA: phosphoglucosamine mutase [Spirochaetota bacterium]|jgi:phosphomannomutase|nr:MAG: Phosphomannomutase/phosphoglucomutase [Spirochaetes bacterium ADurb.Bin218]HOK01077.1 phosphoglucosamine mutase [Spirochaetota bacterium]HOK91402.1 phosphoglucosamine mutase [Spirochaetota bacterium]HON15684.1 phosphoglucosamine mutase [Spirochaetota bacterium]HOV08041.1 phosphoglucosamine mutase [Spirochaetota bacterium]